MNWNGYIFFHLQQPEVVEFPNPLLENPIKEESGEIIIPGNRALINLNLSRKFFYSYAIKENSDRKWFAMLRISSMFFSWSFTIDLSLFHIPGNKCGEIGVEAFLISVQRQAEVTSSVGKPTGLMRLSLSVSNLAYDTSFDSM